MKDKYNVWYRVHYVADGARQHMDEKKQIESIEGMIARDVAESYLPRAKNIALPAGARFEYSEVLSMELARQP